MKSKTMFNAYIDGFNLYKGSLEKRPALKWLDLMALSKALMPNYELGEIYYFTAPLKKKFPEDRANERQHAYLRVLEDQGIRVIRGKFRRSESWLRMQSKNREEFVQPPFSSILGFNQWQIKNIFSTALPDYPMANVTKFEEKGSDVNLAAHLLRDVYKNSLLAALVITGDSDLNTPIQFAVENSVYVKVIRPGNGGKSDHISKIASEVSNLNLELLGECLLKNPHKIKSGSDIYKPITWN